MPIMSHFLSFISDCHNLISITMKGKVQSQQQKNISYRSYTKFDVDIFNSELNQVAFPDWSEHICLVYVWRNLGTACRHYLLAQMFQYFQCHQKCQTLNDLCDVFNLSQLITNPTCFKKGCTPSLVDVILTNQKNMVQIT
jgi:hypothetical protein